MTRKTIKNRIIFTSLTGVGLILVMTGLVANWLIVRWLETGFDTNLLTKAQVLVTLFEEVEEGLEFVFADEFMPEFERPENPEYYQFWYSHGEIFEKSHSLILTDLPYSLSLSDAYAFQDLDLEDSKDGRMVQIHFVPQLAEELRTETRTASDQNMILVVARERQSLDLYILIVNATILFSIPAILLSIFFAIRYGVDSGLKPLEEIKAQIGKLDVNKLSQRVEVTTPVMDMESIVSALNQVLSRIEQSFKREQRFTSDAAHELRTPITELMNMAEVAKKWPGKVNHKEFYADVLASSMKMQLIVNSLLDLARCKNGQIKLQSTTLNLSDRIDDAWPLYCRLAEEKNIRFLLRGDRKIRINSSQVELDFVLSNIISNAVEYGDNDSTINASIMEDTDSVSISISNRTSSLEPEDIPHMFESLWRKDDSRNSERHIGMGLTIVQAFIELLDLEIEASLNGQTYSVVISGLKIARGQ